MKHPNRFSRLEEFYQAINTLIQWLKKEGHLEDAQNLSNALVAGATGSEIIGEIMLALKNMKGEYPQALREELDACYDFTRKYRTILGLDKFR